MKNTDKANHVPVDQLKEIKLQMESGLSTWETSEAFMIKPAVLLRTAKKEGWKLTREQMYLGRYNTTGMTDEEFKERENAKKIEKVRDKLIDIDADDEGGFTLLVSDDNLVNSGETIDKLLIQARDAAVDEERFNAFRMAVGKEWISKMGFVCLRAMKFLDNASQKAPHLIVENAAKIDKLDIMLRRNMGLDSDVAKADQCTDMIKITEMLKRRREENIKLQEAGVDMGCGKLLKDAEIIEIEK